jgi:hypothetical protein
MADGAFAPPDIFLYLAGLPPPGGLSDHQRGHLLRTDIAHIPPDTTAAARIPLNVVIGHLPAVLIFSSFFKPADQIHPSNPKRKIFSQS